MTYRHILLGTDFSDAAEAAARKAANLARSQGARLTLLHVVEHFPEDLPLELGIREDQDPKTVLMENARERLAMLAEQLGMGDATQRVIVSGSSARQEIQQYATREQVDLVVVGSLPHGLLGSLGSTAGGLVHTLGCDLLVVRGGAEHL